MESQSSCHPSTAAEDASIKITNELEIPEEIVFVFRATLMLKARQVLTPNSTNGTELVCRYIK